MDAFPQPFGEIYAKRHDIVFSMAFPVTGKLWVRGDIRIQIIGVLIQKPVDFNLVAVIPEEIIRFYFIEWHNPIPLLPLPAAAFHCTVSVFFRQYLNEHLTAIIDNVL
jgi:hypothetical protein